MWSEWLLAVSNISCPTQSMVDKEEQTYRVLSSVLYEYTKRNKIKQVFLMLIISEFFP